VIEVVFFDAGDTLLHAHPSFPELFARVCERNGVAVAVERVRAVQERLAPHLVDLGEETGVDKPSLSAEASRRFWTHLYRRLLDELGIRDESLARELYATFSHMSSYKLFDDVLPTLDRLSGSGYTLGLISNFERWLEEMLVELEVGHIFDVTVISGVEGVEKPDVAIYEKALERAGIEASAAVHVGDSPTLDVAPATQAGMIAVLLDRAGRYPDAEGIRLTSLAELPNLLARIDPRDPSAPRTVVPRR
jgi:putative hydrolase of the HAD superfamily